MNNYIINFRKLIVAGAALFFIFIISVIVPSATSSTVTTTIYSATTTSSIEPTIATTTVEKKIRVLIVPGHEPDYGGAVFKTIKERDLNLELATDLEKLLATDPHFEVTMTRDADGWNPVFSDYFKNNWDDIIAWENASARTFKALVANGTVKKTYSPIDHNRAPDGVVNRLYGINKWANENDIDIVLNVHFDDDGNHRHNIPGRYSGFVIYEPAPQYDNYASSSVVADALLPRLKEAMKVGNFPGEKTGIIKEPELIAIGEFNTLKTASVLVEYGFIYEKKITNPKLRAKTLADMAEKTYQALADYWALKQ